MDTVFGHPRSGAEMAWRKKWVEEERAFNWRVAFNRFMPWGLENLQAQGYPVKTYADILESEFYRHVLEEALEELRDNSTACWSGMPDALRKSNERLMALDPEIRLLIRRVHYWDAEDKIPPDEPAR